MTHSTEPNMMIGIIGTGFVGEHLTKVFNRNKHNRIIAYDISLNRINYLKNTYDKKLKNVEFQNTLDNLDMCDLFLVSVPTDVTDKKPDLKNLVQVKNMLDKIAKKGSTIVIESSVYVGGTREIFSDFIDKGVYVGFSPERVDPGRVEPASYEIPKIISGLTEESLEKISSFYKLVFNKCITVSSCETAEMCKLYENCFRVVNIAYANEISDMCIQNGIDPTEMVKASSSKPFGFMPFYSGLGVGGHCLPYNPYYLMNRQELPILNSSISYLEKRPCMKAKELVDKYDFKSALVVGLGFKPGESLLTNSPGYSLAKELIMYEKSINGYDPLVKRSNQKIPFDLITKDQFNTSFIMDNFDIVIVAMKQNEVNTDILKNIKSMGMSVIYY